MTVGTLMTWHSGLQLSMAIFFVTSLKDLACIHSKSYSSGRALKPITGYFKSGHVRTVELWVPSNSLCLLRAFVNPSQKSPDKQHHAWVAVKVDGQILTAHCTCMAG